MAKLNGDPNTTLKVPIKGTRMQKSLQVAPLPLPPTLLHCGGSVFAHARAVVLGRDVFLIGRGATLRVDALTGAARACAPTLFPRKKFAAAAVGDRIYVAGGSARTAAVEEYDPEVDAWRVVGEAPRRRYGCAGASAGGVFYVAGGVAVSGEGARALEAHVCAGSVDALHVASGTWARPVRSPAAAASWGRAASVTTSRSCHYPAASSTSLQPQSPSIPFDLPTLLLRMHASISFALAPASSPDAASFAPAAADVGGAVCLGYGIAIAVGVLVFISTVMLASYICVRAKAGAAAVLLADDDDGGAPAASAVVVLGLDGPAIDALYPKFLHVGVGDDDDACAGAQCAICLGEFVAGDALRRGPGCGHRFHAECAERWLRVSATCPVCRDSPLPSPMATPLAEAVPLAAHAR
uniref:RING-type domain-containing protein n=1 Tax=Oryza barthii TaxID=65489 RepID=A0A0D3HHY3_9ORYZ